MKFIHSFIHAKLLAFIDINIHGGILAVAVFQFPVFACCSRLDFEPVVSKYQDDVITAFSRFNNIDTTAGNAGKLKNSYLEYHMQ
jgi:hypothetical protein